MTAPYSLDLRERALARKDGGETNREIAAALRISPSCVSKWTKRKRETGSLAPAQIGGYKPRTLSGASADWLRARIAAGPFTLRGLSAELAERGIKTHPRAVWVFVHAESLSFKNVWPAPSARGLSRSLHDQSASTYPASKDPSRPRWRYARFGPHKTPGVERRFLNQASGTPFDCQAISLPPLANLIDRTAPLSADRPTATPPRAIP
jgi:transposase